jgi:DNA-binding transcriptional LysR family regulator
VEAAFQQAGVPMQVAMNLGSIEVIKWFVAIGLGLAIVPHVVVMDEVRTGQVVAIPIHGLPVREIGLSNAWGNVALLLRPPFSCFCVRISHTTPGEH